MIYNDFLGGLAFFSQGVLVDSVEDGFRFPPAVEHDILIRYAKSVQGRSVVVPEVVESEQGKVRLF